MLKNKRALYLMTAIVLVFLGGFLASRQNGEPQQGDGQQLRQSEIRFPRQTRPSRNVRSLSKTQPTASKPATAIQEPGLLEKAIDASDLNPFVFVEFNGLQHNPLAESLMDCHAATIDQTVNETLNRFGVDLKRDIDRLAFAPDLFAVSGFFDNFEVTEESMGDVDFEREPYGSNAEVLTRQGAFLGRIGNQMLVMSRKKEAVLAAIDRAEGNRPVGTAPRFDGVGGDLYGQIAGQWLKPIHQIIAQNVGEDAFEGDVIERAMVRSFVQDHVALSADLQVKNVGQTDELLSIARAAVSAARFDAMRSGNQNAAFILDRINLHKTARGQIGLDLALPKDMILESFGCSPQVDAGSQVQAP